jgi:hypothetical protein
MVGHFLLRIATRRRKIAGIVRHHWKEIEKSETLATLFPEPPVVAFRRPKNIKDILVRAAVSRLSEQRGQRFTFFNFFPMMTDNACNFL